MHGHGHRQLATVRNYGQLIAVLRARSDELEITREITDAAGHLPSGYAGKLLSRTPVKNLGAVLIWRGSWRPRARACRGRGCAKAG